jgi:cellulose synthase/poly-beta-1,6-N-acetylglucosamine synthase-like glycosyltransferase
MPWLTYHMAWPMILITGWALGRVIDTTDWTKLKEQRIPFTIATLAYAFLGYPVLVALLARLCPRPLGKGGADFLPTVTAVVVVRNGVDRVVARVRNLLESDYPAERLGVVVVSDGSTDGTEAVLNALGDPRLRVLGRERQRGKASGINAALAQTTSEVVVLGDLRQCFAPETIREFVRCFADPKVGAVCGALEVVSGTDAVSGGVDAHWRLENFVRRQEATFDSSIGYTGAICAVRRAAFVAIPEDTILDDVVIPMLIAQQGFRVVYEPAARATDPQPFALGIEHRRKRRTMAGNFQMLFRYPRWLLPWHNRLWWQLISHKYLRLLGFPLLVTMLAANLALLRFAPYRALLAGQMAFYLLAGVGLAAPRLRHRLFALPASFVFVTWRTMLGLRDYLRTPSKLGWDQAA